ncbi:MAG: DUF3102 domain-containing protein [Peptococcaceae bacterium]|nr:DUF3102 domain-containing protein [Peptococcaceae bacterium]
MDTKFESINSYKQIAGHAIFEIGRRLKWVREKDLTRGQWENWLKDNFEFDRSTAYRFIQVYTEFSNVGSIQHLGQRKLFEILSLPKEINKEQFLQQQHIIPSTGEQNLVIFAMSRNLPISNSKKFLKDLEIEPWGSIWELLN